jgi:hypothetical protein
MSLRNLLRESSEAESEFLDSEHEAPEIPRRLAVPPRGAVLTMRDVRAVGASSRLLPHGTNGTEGPNGTEGLTCPSE